MFSSAGARSRPLEDQGNAVCRQHTGSTTPSPAGSSWEQAEGDLVIVAQMLCLHAPVCMCVCAFSPRCFPLLHIWLPQAWFQCFPTVPWNSRIFLHCSNIHGLVWACALSALGPAAGLTKEDLTTCVKLYLLHLPIPEMVPRLFQKLIFNMLQLVQKRASQEFPRKHCCFPQKRDFS